jgi:hypothetical protein
MNLKYHRLMYDLKIAECMNRQRMSYIAINLKFFLPTT